MNLIKLKLTKQQVEALSSLRDEMKQDADPMFGTGMLVAQVFLFTDSTGGMAVGYVKRDDCEALQELMGTPKGKLLSREDVGKIFQYFKKL